MKRIVCSSDFYGASISGMFLVCLFMVLFTSGLSILIFFGYLLILMMFTRSEYPNEEDDALERQGEQ